MFIKTPVAEILLGRKVSDLSLVFLHLLSAERHRIREEQLEGNKTEVILED